MFLAHPIKRKIYEPSDGLSAIIVSFVMGEHSMNKRTIVLIGGMVITAAVHAGEVAEDPMDIKSHNCQVIQIATGNFFLTNLTTGRLNLKESALRVAAICSGPATAEYCPGGNTHEACNGAEQLGYVAALIQDAWDSRQNLLGWLNNELRAGEIVVFESGQYIQTVLTSDPVKVSGLKVIMSDRRDFKSPNEYSKGTVLSTKSEVEFDCATNMFRYHGSTFYSENRWQGSIVEKISTVDQWQPVQKNTVAELELLYACSKLRRHRA